MHKHVLFELDLMHEWSSAVRKLREEHHGEQDSVSEGIAACPYVAPTKTGDFRVS